MAKATVASRRRAALKGARTRKRNQLARRRVVKSGLRRPAVRKAVRKSVRKSVRRRLR